MATPASKRGLAAGLLTIFVIPPLVLLGFWAWRTAVIDAPYDEVWIGLNSRLPRPMRAWACGQVKGRVGRAAVPPYGCHDGLW